MDAGWMAVVIGDDEDPVTVTAMPVDMALFLGVLVLSTLYGLWGRRRPGRR